MVGLLACPLDVWFACPLDGWLACCPLDGWLACLFPLSFVLTVVGFAAALCFHPSHPPFLEFDDEQAVAK